MESAALSELTSTTCESLTGTALAADGESAARTGDFVSSTIQLTGENGSRLSIVAALPSARELAAGMFQMPVEELADDEVLDAIGEIANVLAGGVLAETGSDCRMSTPENTLVEGLPTTWGETPSQAELSCNGHLVAVQLLPETDQEN